MKLTLDEVHGLGHKLVAIKQVEEVDALGATAVRTVGRLVSRLRSANGGKARAENMSAKERSESASAAATARWEAKRKAEREAAKKGKG